MILGNSVVKDQKKTEEIRNPEEKNNMLLVNILILNPRSGQYPLSVFGRNVSCNGNAPEMGF